MYVLLGLCVANVFFMEIKLDSRVYKHFVNLNVGKLQYEITLYWKYVNDMQDELYNISIVILIAQCNPFVGP